MEIQSIPLASHESEMQRTNRIIKWIIIGWAASMIFMGSVLYAFAFAEYETVTETTTTTEETWTSENNADSGDGGITYAGGGDLTVGNGEQ